jgi:hypothetical protein
MRSSMVVAECSGAISAAARGTEEEDVGTNGALLRSASSSWLGCALWADMRFGGEGYSR